MANEHVNSAGAEGKGDSGLPENPSDVPETSESESGKTSEVEKPESKSVLTEGKDSEVKRESSEGKDSEVKSEPSEGKDSEGKSESSEGKDSDSKGEASESKDAGAKSEPAQGGAGEAAESAAAGGSETKVSAGSGDSPGDGPADNESPKDEYAGEAMPAVEAPKNWFQQNWSTLVLLLIGMIGAGLIAYPTFSDWWNSFHQSRAVASYLDAVTDMKTEDYQEIIDAAARYNRRLARSGARWSMTEEEIEEYNSLLDVDGSGIMGYIDIPKINIKLPVYHGTSDSVLQVAIGHLEATSLPVGGLGTHCVVSGHRGLPSARLFTDLDKLIETDLFTFTVLNYTMTYEVDQIRIVEPTNLSDLQIKRNKDYFTLVTCTPYGINTHRLLVRAHRVENVHGPALVTADALIIEPIYIAPMIAAPMILVLLIIMFITTGRKKRLKKLRQLKQSLNRPDDFFDWEDDE